jgi:hypothetical protein
MPWMNNVNEMRDKLLTVLNWVDVKTIKSEQFTPAFVEELPLLSFYFGDETIDDTKPRPIIRQRHLPVNFDICRAADQDEQLDAWLYERAFEVEQAIDNSNFLEFTYVDDLILSSVTPGTIPTGTDQDVRVLRVTYTIDYKTEIKPFGSLDEFLKFRAQYDIDQDQSRFEAEDMVTIRDS